MDFAWTLQAHTSSSFSSSSKATSSSAWCHYAFSRAASFQPVFEFSQYPPSKQVLTHSWLTLSFLSFYNVFWWGLFPSGKFKGQSLQWHFDPIVSRYPRQGIAFNHPLEWSSLLNKAYHIISNVLCIEKINCYQNIYVVCSGKMEKQHICDFEIILTELWNRYIQRWENTLHFYHLKTITQSR